MDCCFTCFCKLHISVIYLYALLFFFFLANHHFCYRAVIIHVAEVSSFSWPHSIPFCESHSLSTTVTLSYSFQGLHLFFFFLTVDII